MDIRDALKTAIRGLMNAKVRSSLTMLGIVIGIASVILLLSIGKSAEKMLVSEVQGVGSNLIFVIPGATKGSRFASPPSVQGVVIKTLVKADVDALKRDASIRFVAPEVRGQAKIVHGNNDTTVTYEGTNADFFHIRNFSVAEGRLFSESDVASFNRVAVLGSEIAETLFVAQNPVGKTIRLKNVSFTVIGVLASEGLGPFGVDQDNLVIIPISVAQKQLLGIDHYNVINVEARDTYTVEFATSRVTSILRQTHGIADPTKDDFTIRTQEDALALLGNVTNIMTLFLFAIASISLIVGGIGIMNIMLVSVIERTKEIGLRKALGARNRDILIQFLFEATMLTVAGGIAGVVVGSSFVVILYFILSRVVSSGWIFSLPLYAIGLSVLVSTLTGLVFGLYPARQAAQKNPIDALRYE